MSRAGVLFLASVILHTLVGVPYLSSGLVAPAWAAALLILVWLGLMIAIVRLRNSWTVITVPFIAAGVWMLALAAGEKFLDWSA